MVITDLWAKGPGYPSNTSCIDDMFAIGAISHVDMKEPRDPPRYR